jgi:hypothetical protein
MGTLTLVALTLWLRTLKAGSIAFCWAVWVILGQASGAYVGPKTWAVLLIAAAASVLATRSVAATRSALPDLVRLNPLHRRLLLAHRRLAPRQA